MLEPIIPLDEATRLAALRGLKILDTPREERFDRLTRLAQRIIGVPIAMVSLVDSNRQWFKSCQGMDTSETPRGISFCGHAILDDRVFIIPDALLDPRFADNPLVTGAPNIRFYAGQPLKALDGSRIGALSVIDSKPHNMTQAEVDGLRELAVLVENELNSLETHELAIALQSSKDRLSAIFDNVLDGIITIDERGIVESCNRTAANIFGYSVEEVIGNNIKMLMPDPYSSKNDSYLNNFTSTGQKKIIGIGREVVGQRKDGSTFLVDLAVSEIRLGDKSIFTGIMRDITERKQVEQSLADRERFMKTLVDIIPGVVGYWTNELHCGFANRNYLEWFGKTQEQMRGITVQNLLGDELFRQNEPFIRGALRGKPQRFERTLINADGSARYTWTHYIPDVNIDTGLVQGFFVMINDITEFKMTQVHLEELNFALKTARDEA